MIRHKNSKRLVMFSVAAEVAIDYVKYWIMNCYFIKVFLIFQGMCLCVEL